MNYDNLNYDNLMFGELESLAYQTNNTLALAMYKKYHELESELGDQIDSLKDELRELKIEPVLEKINNFCSDMVEYHKSENHLENYFCDSKSIIDLVMYDGSLKVRLERELGDLAQDEYEHILELIASNYIATNIRKTHMDAYPSPGFIEVCGYVMGEVEEQLNDDLVKLIEENGISEDEINSHIGGYYSDGFVYFDYSYDVVFVEASIQEIEQALADYRADKGE